MAARGSVQRRSVPPASLVEAIAAVLWFSWLGASAPRWVVVLSQVGALLSVVVLVVAVTRWRRQGGFGRDGDPMADPVVRRGYQRVLAAYLAVLVVGAFVLIVSGAGSFVSPWVALLVGVHFVPLSRVFDQPALQVVGVAVVVVAVAGAVVGWTTSVEPATVVGIGTGACLLAGSLAGLLMRRHASAQVR